MDRSLKKLSRVELLELLVGLSEDCERLSVENARLKKMVAARQQSLEQAVRQQQHLQQQMQQLAPQQQAAQQQQRPQQQAARQQRTQQPERQQQRTRQQAGQQKSQNYSRSTKVGSIAEAALQANGYFEAAQRSADEYLREIKRLRDGMVARANSAKAAAPEEVQAVAQRQAQAVLRDAQQRARQIVERATAQAETIIADAKAQSEETLANANRRSHALLSRADQVVVPSRAHVGTAPVYAGGTSVRERADADLTAQIPPYHSRGNHAGPRRW